MSMQTMLMAARRGEGPLRFARRAWRGLLALRLPVVRPVGAVLWTERELRHRLWPVFAKIVYREPMLRYRCEAVGERLHMEGALPLIIGDGRICIGDDVTLGGRNTWVVGFKVSEEASLEIGDRVSVNYQTTISVAKRVRIGDDTMVAANVQIYDNVSHPLSPARRLRHEPFTLDEASPVEIGRNVWLGTGAVVMRGVTIGDGAVVAAGSIVTRDVPPNTLVAGNPATVRRELVD